MILQHNEYVAEASREEDDALFHGVVVNAQATLHFAGPLPRRSPTIGTGAVNGEPGERPAMSDDFAIFSAADYLDNDEVIADFLAAAAEDGNPTCCARRSRNWRSGAPSSPDRRPATQKPRSDFPAQRRLSLGRRCAALREAPENPAAACPFT